MFFTIEKVQRNKIKDLFYKGVWSRCMNFLQTYNNGCICTHTHNMLNSDTPPPKNSCPLEILVYDLIGEQSLQM